MQRLTYALIAPNDPALAPLIAQHAAHSAAHYPAESNHHEDGAALAAQGALIFAARSGDAGAVVAMGGYKMIGPAAAEVKSMHVLAAARGQGVGAHILALILDHARAAGARRISLETGSLPASAPARAIYEKAGFVQCPPFGNYAADPMSIFMTRAL